MRQSSREIVREVTANQVFFGTREADSEILMEKYVIIAGGRRWGGLKRRINRVLPYFSIHYKYSYDK